MSFKEAMELEEKRHSNKMQELENERQNILLRFEKRLEVIRIDMAEKRKLEQMKYEMIREGKNGKH